MLGSPIKVYLGRNGEYKEGSLYHSTKYESQYPAAYSNGYQSYPSNYQYSHNYPAGYQRQGRTNHAGESAELDTASLQDASIVAIDSGMQEWF